jgi:Tol biopolymer transport system component
VAGNWYAPAWSADSRWLVAVRGYPGRIYRVRLDGDSLALVTDIRLESCTSVEWSAAGRLAYAAAGGIWLANADGSGSRLLTTWYSPDARDPSWSPDGASLVYTDGNIAVLGLDSTSPVWLTADTAHYWQPAWSPDGSSVAFSTAPTSGWWPAYRIQVLDLASGQRQTAVPSDAFNPTWSPDSRHICYARREFVDPDRYRSELWIVDSDGENPKRLTE